MNREEHLLVILAEECAEVQQVVAKILRFGEGTHFDNVEALQKEFNDVLAMADMIFADHYELHRDEELIEQKIDKVEHYLKESRELGTLEDE